MQPKIEMYADAPWGVRNLNTGTWRGCPGSVAVSHQGALQIQNAQPSIYKAERNPADVLAEELGQIGDEKIVPRAAG